MPERFIKKIAENFPELPEHRTLLAVSGGVDSMSMLHLFESAGWPYGIAHCNFQLRGSDSAGDHDFIKATALHQGKTFHSIVFDTEAEALERGVSIQMAARELRYRWLEAIRQEHGYDFIATAHHLNDSIETSLINQTRGTGLRGITGITARQGRIIRPLLGFTRSELMDYLTAHEVAYREDSSNAKDEYHRNRIRHHVIPVLQGINPSFEKTYEKNLKIWSESANLVEWACAELARQYVTEEGEQKKIDYHFFIDHPDSASTLLFEWVKDQGFHIDQLHQALLVAGKSSGAIWYSATHRLLADRKIFIIEPLRESNQSKQANRLEKQGDQVSLDHGLIESSLYDRPAVMDFFSSENVALLDAKKVAFPLTIRHWQEGDVFCPLGLGGRHKKVQDYFSDLKLDRFEKEQVWLVVDPADNIVWIVGHRLDDRYKIEEQTSRILKLEYRV